MSTSNVNDIAGSKREAGVFPAPALACEAHDLRRILTHLADQVADADRRHSDALSQMQERLGLLGSAAQGLRGQLPNEMTSVLDRIEGGMAELSERIAEADAQRRHASAPATASALATVAMAVAMPSAQQQPVTSHSPSAPAATGEAAPALRSALAAEALDAYARRAQSARSGGKEPVDNFDVVDTALPIRDPETWDGDTVEALARLYEAHGVDPALAAAHDSAASASATPVHPAIHAGAEPPHHNPPAPASHSLAVEPTAPMISHLPAMLPGLPSVPASPPPATKAEIAAEVMTLQAKAFEGEREWLEQRFASVAQRLEQSLVGLQTSGSLDALDVRFTTLESKLTEVMGSTAKTADLAGLKSIESQIEDLNAQLVTVQTHFSRLDTIELELRALAERMTGDEFAKLFEHKAAKPEDNEALAGAVASRVAQQMPKIEEALQSIAERLSAEKIAGLMAEARPAGPDAGAIAKLVADLMSQRMPKPAAPQADPTARLDELKVTLEAFVAEQRHGDEQTTTMLDTMQQAMIRMLDRMDAIEQARYAEPAEDPDAYQRRPPARVEEPHDAYEPAARRYESRIDESYAATAAPHFDPAPAPVRPTAPPVEEPRYASHIEEPAAVPARVAPRPSPAVETDLPVAAANSREDFIASARRAARMAAEAAPEGGEPAEAAPARTSVLGKIGKKSAEPGNQRQLSRMSMAMMCLILVGISFIAVKSTILAPSAPPASTPAVQGQQSRAPNNETRSNAERRLQNLEDADVLIDDDRARRAPDANGAPSPRRSSLPGQSGGDERDYGLPPLPGDASRQIAGASAVPASLTRDIPAGATGPRSNDMPPLGIGPNSLRSAAAKGDPSAEFEVGARFAEGRGVQQDLQQAITWYQRAAAQGFAPAQYRLGSMFERGLGVKADMAKARVWYQRAAEQGIVKAMHNLAVLSAGRDSAVTDYEAAGKWFRAAADYGLTDSQFNLAIMYDSGLGLERDAKLAFKWFSLAARSGDDEASRRRESLRQKLQSQEVAQVEAEIMNWRPKSAEQAVNDPRSAGELWKSRVR